MSKKAAALILAVAFALAWLIEAARAQEKAATRAVVRGVIVDESGAPVEGCNIDLGDGSSEAATDAAGRFTIRCPLTMQYDGPYIYRDIVVPVEGERLYTRIRLNVVRFDEIVLDGSRLEQDTTVVVKRPPDKPYIGGTIMDDSGKLAELTWDVNERAVEPKIRGLGRTVSGLYKEIQCHVRGGIFVVIFEDPIHPALEFTFNGHQARILQLERDYNFGDLDLRVVLKKGPYAERESIWSAATGLPNTQNAVLSVPWGQEVKLREHFIYERLAGRVGGLQVPDWDVVRRAPVPPTELDIIVKDLTGAPVQDVQVRAVQNCPGEDVRYDNAVPRDEKEVQSIHNRDGRYTIPNGSLVESAGTAPVLAYSAPGQNYTPPLPLVLGLPSSVTLTAVDCDGKPVIDAAAGVAGEYAISWRDRTNAEGRVTFDDLQAAAYVFRAANASSSGSKRVSLWETAAVVLRPGEHVERTVVLTPPEPDSVEALALEWLTKMDQPYNKFSLEHALDGLAASDAQAVEDLRALTLKWLSEQPVLENKTMPVADLFSMLAVHFELKEALKPMCAMFASPRLGRFEPRLRGGALRDAIIHFRGKRSATFFAQIAADEDVRWDFRVQSLIALGRLGDHRSIRLWKKLRDAAYANSSAPEHRDSYTHAQRIEEAATMVLATIPGMQAFSYFEPVLKNTAWVSPDYSEGKVMLCSMHNVHLRRFDDEWMVTDVLGP